MADLPIAEDNGQVPVTINDPTTVQNSAKVNSDGSINVNTIENLHIINNKGFSLIVEILPLSASETPVLLIKNPSGSGKSLKLNLIILGILPTVGSATGNNDVFRLYVNPNVTVNGTAVTVNNLYSQTSPPTSVITPFSTPTVTSNGTKLGAYSVDSQNGLSFIPQNGTRILSPNNSWLITQNGLVNGAATGLIQLEWIEE